jgi:hypothetical protein
MYTDRIRDFCVANGVVVPIGFGRNPAHRYAVIELTDPPKLVARTWFKQEDVAYYCEQAGAGVPRRILDFQALRELEFHGHKGLVTVGPLDSAEPAAAPVPADLEGCITELELGEHREFLLRIARPSVELISAEVPIAKGCSKFGGCPDVSADFEWPHHKHGPYRFIGQVNLAEIPTRQHGLPSSGLLSFFYADEIFWQDPDYVRCYRFDNLSALKGVEPPAAVRMGATCTVKFQPGMDVRPWPWDDSAAKQWPIDAELREAYWELRCKLHPSGRYLMGYPFNTTLAYDPTPGPDWLSLLTLSSDDELEWCWHDGDWLVTFIEDQRLRVGDFSQIRSDAG